MRPPSQFTNQRLNVREWSSPVSINGFFWPLPLLSFFGIVQFNKSKCQNFLLTLLPRFEIWSLLCDLLTHEEKQAMLREAFFHRVKYRTQNYDCLYFSAMLKVLTQSFGIDVRYFIQVSYSGLLSFLFLTLFYKRIWQPSYTKTRSSFLTSPLGILY